MTWSYCTDCGSGLDEPTLAEMADNATVCACGTRNDPRRTLGEGLEEYAEETAAFFAEINTSIKVLAAAVDIQNGVFERVAQSISDVGKRLTAMEERMDQIEANLVDLI